MRLKNNDAMNALNEHQPLTQLLEDSIPTDPTEDKRRIGLAAYKLKSLDSSRPLASDFACVLRSSESEVSREASTRPFRGRHELYIDPGSG